MRNESFNAITNIIYQIETTEKYIAQLKDIKETINQTILNEMARKKQKLVKKLLVEMLSNGVSLSQFEDLYQKIFKYLKDKDDKNTISGEKEKVLLQAGSFLSNS